MRYSPVLAVLSVVAAFAPAGRAQDAPPLEWSESDRRRMEFEPAFREYLRRYGTETDAELARRRATRPPNPWSGRKQGDFWTQDELRRLFPRGR